MDVKNCTRKLGGAGNVAANLAALGAQTSLCSVIGDDFPKQKIHAMLEEAQICAHHIVVEDSRKTLLKARLSVDDNMIYRIDRGTTHPITKDSEQSIIEYLKDKAKDFDAIIISDYNKGFMSGNIIESLVGINREHNIFIAMDGRGYHKYTRVGLSLITPNFDEGAELIGCKDYYQRLQDAATWGEDIYDKTRARLCALTIDKDGVLLFKKGIFQYHSATRCVKKPYVCGAGDTFIATQTLCLIGGSSLYQSIDIANKAAWIRIQKKNATVCHQKELLMDSINHNSEKLFNNSHRLKQLIDLQKESKKIILTNGCFDIFHSGHVKYLEKAKQLGDILIIAINTDESVQRLKGEDRPINKLKDRISVLSALSCVDYIIPFGANENDNASELIKVLQPDIYVKGNDYNPKNLKELGSLKEANCEIHFIPIVPHQSTTKIIRRIRTASNQTLKKSS